MRVVCYVVLLCVSANALEELKSRSDFYNVTDLPLFIPGNVEPAKADAGVFNEMKSTTHMSVIHYECSANVTKDQVLILYGTKSWTFPVQDVNLTLSYPANNPDSQFSPEDQRYAMAAFKVVLYIDGLTTKGYITEGGVLQESLTLTFVCSSITSLRYEFWLYGTPTHLTTDLGLNAHFICT